MPSYPGEERKREGRQNRERPNRRASHTERKIERQKIKTKSGKSVRPQLSLEWVLGEPPRAGMGGNRLMEPGSKNPAWPET